MYLETILTLSRKGAVRSVDVANALGYSKPSVSRAMALLRENQYVVMDDGQIHLTESGEEKAGRIYERHLYLKRFLMDTLGVTEAIASEDACRIEHVISETSFQKIKERYTAK